MNVNPNPSAVIENAIRTKIKEVRDAKLERLAREAMANQDFVNDMYELLRNLTLSHGKTGQRENKFKRFQALKCLQSALI